MHHLLSAVLRRTTRIVGALALEAALALGDTAVAAERTLTIPTPPSGVPTLLELRAGQVLAFPATLADGDFLQVVLTQAGGDLTTTLVGPGGTPLGSTTTSNDGDPAPLSAIATAPGGYRVEVRLGPGFPRAAFRLRLEGPRPASAEDRQRVRADGALAEGEREANREKPALDLARERYEEALRGYQGLGSAEDEAATWSRLCGLLERRGDSPAWLACSRQEIPLWQAAGNRRREAEALNDVATALHDQGDDRAALEEYEASLPLRRAAGDRIGEGETLSGIGSARGALGDHRQAIAYATQALALLHEARYPWGEAMELNNRAAEYAQVGEPERSLADHRRALAVFEALHDARAVGITHAFMGRFHEAQGDPRAALAELESALAIFRRVGDRRFEGHVLEVMGSALTALRRPAEARARLGAALALARAQGDKRSQASIEVHAGQAALAQGDLPGALSALRDALALAREAQDPGVTSRALFQLACAEHATGALDDAQGHLAESLAITEAIRGALAGADARASFLATAQARYGLLVDVLMGQDTRRPGQGFAAQAFAVSDRARARGLLELLAEARADIREGIPPELLTEAHEVEAALDARAQALARGPAGARAAIAQALEALTARHRDLQAEIRAHSPRYAALTQPAELDPEALGRDQLDDDTVLLEYALGEERSFLWVISSHGMSAHALPPRAAIETAVRRVHARWSTPGGAGGGRDAPAAALARMILAPAARELRARRWLVVADGALLYLPFAALPGVERGRVADDHEVVSLPSAAALMALRDEGAERAPATGTLAILADPVFAPDDPRVRRSGPVRPKARPDAVALLTRSAADTGVASLARLPGSRREAQQIAALVPPSERLEALDFAASRETAMGAELGRYRIVHFASHALLDARHPELSGIVLSLVDPVGRPVPGFLQAHELYNLRLSAELVVLSGCETALGKEVRGEGLVGMARAFMYAGAPRVLASLWKVPDLATAELMRRFYGGMLRDHLPPAAALRAAQSAMARSARWADPNDWAGFVLLGDWR